MEQPPPNPPVPPAVPPPPPSPPDALQFDTVEYADTGSAPGANTANCAACQRPITDSYFEVNGQVMCPNCKAGLQAEISGGSKTGRMLTAFLFGFVAMLITSFGYYLVKKLMNAEFAIATIAMGWAIGWAVHRGAAGRGGYFYQAAAVVLTYCAISFSYVPQIFELMSGRSNDIAVVDDGNSTSAADKNTMASAGETTTVVVDAASKGDVVTDPVDAHGEVDAPSAVGRTRILGMAMFFVLSLPVRMGMESPILILIYAFGLWQAGKMNRRPRIVVTGPYSTRGGVATAATSQDQVAARQGDNQVL